MQNLISFFQNFPEKFSLQDIVAPSGTTPFFRELLTFNPKVLRVYLFILGDLSRQKQNFQGTAVKIAPLDPIFCGRSEPPPPCVQVARNPAVPGPGSAPAQFPVRSDPESFPQTPVLYLYCDLYMGGIYQRKKPTKTPRTKGAKASWLGIRPFPKKVRVCPTRK